eukprot:3705299-Rhodomonas_salina.2
MQARRPGLGPVAGSESARGSWRCDRVPSRLRPRPRNCRSARRRSETESSRLECAGCLQAVTSRPEGKSGRAQ